jgi:hypothetical protein
MLMLDGFRLPFQAAMAAGREECPVCRGSMECIAVSEPSEAGASEAEPSAAADPARMFVLCDL